MADQIDPGRISGAQFWDERFASESYAFGTEPNAFLRREAHRIPAGSKVLAIADGEGRNGVYLASLGHRVTSTDISANGIAKAQRLAAQRGVTIDCRQADLADHDWPEAAYDAVVGIFFQFASPDVRARIFEGIGKSLKPGGMVLIEGYRPKQLEYGTGGPPVAENMYTEDMLRDAFAGWEIVILNSYDAEIHEGASHGGMSALIDLIAIKPQG